MAAVTIHIDFRAKEEEICHCSHIFLFCLPWSDGTGCHYLRFLFLFLIFSFKLAFNPPSSPSSKGSLVPFCFLPLECYHLHIWFWYSPAILIPAYQTSSPAFHMMCSVYKLNKWGDSKHPCHTSFSILNQSVVPYRVITVASWPTYRFLRRQVRWSGIPISLRLFNSLLWPTQSKALA